MTGCAVARFPNGCARGGGQYGCRSGEGRGLQIVAFQSDGAAISGRMAGLEGHGSGLTAAEKRL